MHILFYEDNKITEVASVRSELDLTEEDKQKPYLLYQSSDAIQGMDIRAINEDGSLKSISEQLEMGILELEEDELFENEVIRKLTDDEMKAKFPDRYPDPITAVMEEDTPEQILRRGIAEKEQEIYDLKDQYIDADIEKNEALKQSLREEIQNKKSALAELQERTLEEQADNEELNIEA